MSNSLWSAPAIQNPWIHHSFRLRARSEAFRKKGLKVWNILPLPWPWPAKTPGKWDRRR